MEQETAFRWDPSQPFCMSAETDKINSALDKAIPTIPVVEKTRKAAFGMFAPLDDILQAIREPLHKNGLTLEQYSVGDGWLVTRLAHISGQWIVSGMKFPNEEASRQTKQHGLGGNITYFKRYCISAILRICNDEDTDGHYPKQNSIPITKAELEKLLELLATKDNYAAIVADVLRIEKIKDLNQLTKSAYEELLESLK